MNFSCSPPGTVLCLLVAAMVQSPASGQCTAGGCSPPAAAAHPAVVRVVSVGPRGDRCYGSGTLVARDARQGTVLSCAHVFDDARASIVVLFPDGAQFQAELAAVDRQWDLAALKTPVPRASPVTVAAEHPKPGDRLRSCGYGSDGRYWCNQGEALGYVRTASTTSYETLELSGLARDGDSGGPVFNQQGELVAVLWGTDGRIVSGTYCGRIRKFLARICPLGGPPRQEPGLVPIAPQQPPSQPSLPAPADPLDAIRQRLESLAGEVKDSKAGRAEQERSWGERMEKIETAFGLLAALRDRVAKAEEAVGRDNLRGMVREVATGIIAERGPGLVETLLPAVLAALGWTGPPSIAAIIAIRLIAGLVRRRVARRGQSGKNGPRRPSTPPKPLNDDYAAQLAQVYALSGRSPIADATLGRQYDEELRLAEQSSDAALARWARALRERVARRFYRIHDPSPVPSDPPEPGGQQAQCVLAHAR